MNALVISLYRKGVKAAKFAKKDILYIWVFPDYWELKIIFYNNNL